MKFDVKSVVIGVLGSFLLMFVFGYTERGGEGQLIPSAITWAMVVPPGGKVLAKAADGKAFLIDVDSSRATKVEFDKTRIAVTTEQVVLSGKD